MTVKNESLPDRRLDLGQFQTIWYSTLLKKLDLMILNVLVIMHIVVAMDGPGKNSLKAMILQAVCRYNPVKLISFV